MHALKTITIIAAAFLLVADAHPQTAQPAATDVRAAGYKPLPTPSAPLPPPVNAPKADPKRTLQPTAASLAALPAYQQGALKAAQAQWQAIILGVEVRP